MNKVNSGVLNPLRIHGLIAASLKALDLFEVLLHCSGKVNCEGRGVETTVESFKSNYIPRRCVLKISGMNKTASRTGQIPSHPASILSSGFLGHLNKMDSGGLCCSV